MPVDATGAATTKFGIPKYATGADAPSGKGLNNIMDSLDTILSNLGITSPVANDVPVYDSIAGKWKKAGGTPSSATYLRGDGSWQAVTPGTPTGSVTQFAAATAPSGWVLCDGTSYLRADGTHDALFAVIGTSYGSVDGTHFTVPDLRGRVPVGYAVSGGHTDVATLGNSDGQAPANRRPTHRTTNNLSVNAGTLAIGSRTLVLGGGGGAHAATTSGVISDSPTDALTGNPALGGSIGTNNGNDALDTPSYVVINYIIKL